MFKSKSFLFILFCYVIFVTVFTYYFIGSESKIYYSNFVLSTFDLFDFVECTKEPGILQSFIYLLNSVQCSEMNILHALPLYPFVVFNMTRYNIVLGISLLYMIPLMIILLKLIFSKLIEYKPENTLLNVYIITAVLFMPGIYFAATRGLADLSGFVIIFLAILYVIDKKFEEKMPIKQPMIYGFLLYTAFLLRRFFIVEDFSIAIAVIVISLIRIFIDNKGEDSYIKIRNLVKNSIIIPGVTFLLCLLIFQTQYLIGMIMFNDSVMEAYGQNIEQNLSDLYKVIGSYYLVLFIVSILCLYNLIKDRDKKLKYLFIFISLIVSTIIKSTYFFINIYTLYIVILINIIILLAISNTSLFIQQKAGKIFSILFTLFFIVINTTCFVLYVTPYKNIPNFIKEIKNCFPKTLEFMPSTPFKFPYWNLIDDIANRIENDIQIKNNKNASVAFWGTEIINFYLFKCYTYCINSTLKNRLINPIEYYTGEGYKLSDINADYAIVTVPPRINAAEEDFLPLFSASEAFKEQENIAESYKLIYKKNIKVNDELLYEIYLYRKEKPVTPEQVEELFDGIVKEASEYEETYDEQLEEYTKIYNERYNI